MKCNCGFTGDKSQFGTLTASYPSGLLASMPASKGGNIGGVDVYICPECGALYCDPRGNIKNTAN